MAGSMTSAFKEALNRKQEKDFEKTVTAPLRKAFATLRPEEYHVNRGPDDPKAQALYAASAKLAKRKVN